MSKKTTSPSFSQLMLGCAPSGGLYHQGVDSSKVMAMIDKAIHHYQFPFIDTAPWYGVGRSEKDIGEAFTQFAQAEKLKKEVESTKEEEIEDTSVMVDTSSQKNAASSCGVITKVGRIVKLRKDCDPSDPHVAWGDNCYHMDAENESVVCVHDYTGKGIWESLQGSLERLTSHAPLVEIRLHDCETDEYMDQFFNHGGLQAMLEIKAKKSLRLSIGMNIPHRILEILKKAPLGTFDSIMLAGSWNLIEQNGWEVLQECEVRNINVHIAGVFGAGLLWGASKYRYQDAEAAIVSKRDQWQKLCDQFIGPAEGNEEQKREKEEGEKEKKSTKDINLSLPALAMKFALAPKAVSHIAIGCACVEELDGCMEAFQHHLPTDAQFDAIMSEAVKIGLLEEKCYVL